MLVTLCEYVGLLASRRANISLFQHAEQCLLWMESVASSRKHELDDLRCDRTDAYGRHFCDTPALTDA
jgi:hypothetical protein